MAGALYIVVADELEKRIRNKEIQNHEKFPSERVLSEEYGVSRAVVREALKVLHEKGYVEPIVGKGNYVKLPTEKEIIGKMESAFGTTADIKKQDIVEAREIIEFAIAGRIVERVDDCDIEMLKTIHQEMEEQLLNGNRFIELDEQFHLQLAAGTKNEVLKIITATLNNITNRKQLFTAKDEIKRRINALAEHKNILEALQKRDKEALHNAIVIHLACVAEHIK